MFDYQFPLDIAVEHVSNNVARHAEIMKDLKAGKVSEDAVRFHVCLLGYDRLVRVPSQLTGHAHLAYQAPLKYKDGTDVARYGIYTAGMALGSDLKLKWMGKVGNRWIENLLPETIELLNNLPVVER